MLARARIVRSAVWPAVWSMIVALAVVVAAPGVSAQAAPDQVRINARWTSVVDGAGRTWAGRTGFTGPVNRSDGLAGRPIAGTDDDVLYRSNLWGMTTFGHLVANGDYRVRLLMAEDYHSQPGRRVFDVAAEGRTVLAGVDIIAAVGARATAYDREFTTTVADGSLDLAFTAKADKPLVSAIEIVRLPGGSATDGTPGEEPTSPDTAAVQALATDPDVSGGGLEPTLRDGVLTTRAGAGDSRSEVFWGTVSGGRFKLTRGTTVTTQFQVRHHFADPRTGRAPDPSTWHTIFQLHGPTLTETWPSPPVTLSWQDGGYRVGGGAVVPTASGSTTNQGSWFPWSWPAPDDQWRTITVTTYLEGPGRGWVSLSIDGRAAFTRWKPRAGTMYTDSGAYSHRMITVKTGLYTGTASPTWDRWVQQRNVSVRLEGRQGPTTAVLR